MDTNGKHLVEVQWVVKKTYEVEAITKDEAVKKITDMVNRGDVCVWTDGFEAGGEKEDVNIAHIGYTKN